MGTDPFWFIFVDRNFENDQNSLKFAFYVNSEIIMIKFSWSFFLHILSSVTCKLSLTHVLSLQRLCLSEIFLCPSFFYDWRLSRQTNRRDQLSMSIRGHKHLIDQCQTNGHDKLSMSLHGHKHVIDQRQTNERNLCLSNGHGLELEHDYSLAEIKAESLYQLSIFLHVRLELGLNSVITNYALLYNLSNPNVGLTDLYISTCLDWFNHKTWFIYLLMNTFSRMDNIQRNLSRFTMDLCIYYICPHFSVSTFVSVHICLCTHLPLSTFVSVHICLCPHLSPSSFVSLLMCLCPHSSLSTFVSIHIYLCPHLSLSIFVSVHICLCPHLSLSTFVSVHICIRATIAKSCYCCDCFRKTDL